MSEGPPSIEAQDVRRAAGREALMASVGILVLLALVKQLSPLVPAFLRGWLVTVVFAVQLYLPLARTGRRGVSLETLGLRLDHWRADLRDFGLAAVLTGVPYSILFHVWQTGSSGQALSFVWPDRFVEQVLIELCVIALAEELFFRGYIQERLSVAWPTRRRLWGAPLGGAVLAASGVFALAHFVGDYRPARLATFFPGLVFGYLFARRGTLLAPVTYHAFCNLLADVLFASHRGS